MVKVNNTTQVGNTNKGTHSLHCGIVHEPDIAARTRAVWVHRRVAVVLLERTCGVIRLVADSTRIGSRRRRAGRLNGLNGLNDLDRDRDCSKTYAMDLLLVLQHHPSTWRILENAERDTNIDKDSFALADTFTGCTNIEGGPRSGLDMIEERLGRHILVGTRAGRVRTGGHSSGAGVGKSLSRHNNVYKYKLPQGDLAPKGMFECLAWRNQRSGHAVGGRFEAPSSKGRQSLGPRCPSDVLGLPNLSRQSASRMLRAVHARCTPKMGL